MNELFALSSPLWLSLKLAFVTTFILLLIGIPLAWWLSRTTSWVKIPLESIVAVPLVLPPTVLGFYLLITLGSNGILGDASIAFTFQGLVVGSIIYSLPFVVQPLQASFESIGAWPMEVAATLRSKPLDRFVSIILPLARRGLLTAIVLGFSHTLGEFGVVLMIGGNIPGKTRVVSIAIYDYVEQMNYGAAHSISFCLLISSFVILMGLYAFNRRCKRVGL